MAKNAQQKNFDVFSKVIAALASDAASEAEGVRLAPLNRSGALVGVDFLPNEKVQVNMNAVILQGYTVPSAVSALQDRVKRKIESDTKFKVQSVNVNVVGVKFEG